MPNPIYNKEAEKVNTINLRRVECCANCKFKIIKSMVTYTEIKCIEHPKLVSGWEIGCETICDDYKEEIL